jgi:hypothetical protein
VVSVILLVVLDGVVVQLRCVMQCNATAEYRQLSSAQSLSRIIHAHAVIHLLPLNSNSIHII